MVQPVKFGQIYIFPDERVYFTDKRKSHICKFMDSQELWSGRKGDNHQKKNEVKPCQHHCFSSTLLLQPDGIP